MCKPALLPEFLLYLSPHPSWPKNGYRHGALLILNNTLGPNGIGLSLELLSTVSLYSHRREHISIAQLGQPSKATFQFLSMVLKNIGNRRYRTWFWEGFVWQYCLKTPNFIRK
eukprot:TRINITY_DN6310_c0_g1_i4.p1 TRINITY_DN6310_c0_g1~~TRINITY_DN6310_c0_g1_i4.p1  ORF type:complete len:113 (+),score=7.05 TRINITY_DN6310_c0_g1_i4:1355-1693(+)